MRSERAGKCGFGDMAGKCGRGERESAPVDRAGKCSWGHDRKVRLGAWQESATAKARDTCIAESKMRPIACLNYRVFSDNLRD